MWMVVKFVELNIDDVVEAKNTIDYSSDKIVECQMHVAGRLLLFWMFVWTKLRTVFTCSNQMKALRRK